MHGAEVEPLRFPIQTKASHACMRKRAAAIEPTLGLAPGAVEELLELLTRIARSGVTLLVVEQDVEGILNIAGDAYSLASGECTALGRAKDLLNDEAFRRDWLTGEQHPLHAV